MGKNGPLSGTTRGHVATAIRIELARNDMSASELARRVGIRRAAFGRRMTGQVPFKVDELTRIASELGVPATTLLPVEQAA
jgi:transcriptional regulator with XRE-family HTH domain